MKGYLKNEEETKTALRHGDWLHTGDLAYYDATEHFFIVGRLKELIKVNALQVAPAELENILKQYPKIADAAVIGIPDTQKGQVPFAFIVKRQNIKDDLTEEEVYNFIHSKVAKYKNLDGGVTFIDMIPYSAAGKILRKDLLQYYDEHLTRRNLKKT